MHYYTHYSVLAVDVLKYSYSVNLCGYRNRKYCCVLIFNGKVTVLTPMLKLTIVSCYGVNSCDKFGDITLTRTLIYQIGDYWATSERNRLKLQSRLLPSIRWKSNVICLKLCSQSCSQ